MYQCMYQNDNSKEQDDDELRCLLGERQQEVQWDGLYGVQGLCALSGLIMIMIERNH